MLNPIWIFLLFAVIAASASERVALGVTVPDSHRRFEPVTKPMPNRALPSLREHT
jgi:hypothetical protein